MILGDIKSCKEVINLNQSWRLFRLLGCWTIRKLYKTKKDKTVRLVNVMKIDGTSISPVGSVQAATRVSQTSKVNTVSEKDQLAVSENAQVFQKLLQKMKEMPDIRDDRVRAISEQIANGEFNLDAASIAEGILSPSGMEGK